MTTPATPACKYCGGARIAGWSGAEPIPCPTCSSGLTALELLTLAWRKQKEMADAARSGEEQAGRERDAAVEQWRKDQAKIDALTDDTIDLSLQVDEWREHFEDVLCGFAFDLGGRVRMGFVPCAHCGWRSEIIPEDEINAAILEHIKTCPKRPMRAVEAERDAAQAVTKEAGRQLGEVGAEKLKAECERDVAQAESAGRLKALEEKAEEARREWGRAENAEAERDVLRAEVERLKAQIDRMRQRIRELEEHRG